MTQETLNKQILITIILLVTVILFFEFTNLDNLIQKSFYNFDTKSWILREDNTLLYQIFYSGFKKVFIVFSVIIILATIFSKKVPIFQAYKKGLIILSLSFIFVPSLALFKNITNMPCPFNVIEFGGKYPEIKLFENYPKDLTPISTLKCYPAGHATMGFSLMALFFLFKNQRNQKIALAFGIAVGVLTGTYKILIGDHFVSHTLVTMLAAWLVILVINKLIYKLQKRYI